MRVVPTSVNGPDFICIGMPKAGTAWLYDQLSHHPDFWMPPLKELHYLDHSIPKLKNSLARLQDWEKALRRAQRQGLAWGDRERAFLTDVAACAGEPRDFNRYANLFQYKGSLLSGDISPGYCTLDDEIIAEIAATLPDTKIILLVREPISRLWSRICMAERNGEFDVSLLDDSTKFAEFIRRTGYAEKSFPTKIVRQWSAHYPANTRFRVILFDDVVQRPVETLREILGFLGANPSTSSTLPADYNRKSNTRKLCMPDPIRNVLVEYLGDEVRACAEMLGGAAQAWPSLMA